MRHYQSLASVLIFSVLAGCGGGGSGGSPVSNDGASSIVEGEGYPDPNFNVVWKETANSAFIPSELITAYIGRGGFGAFNLYGYKNKSFMIPSGREFNTIRTPNDVDFLTLSVTDRNEIFLDQNPIKPKYIAGSVVNILEGNFGFGENSILFIDQGRENGTDPFAFEKSYLWRMDKINGKWVVNEFAQELGKQFWHSSHNPIDINGDGVLDFSVSNLSISKDLRSVLFLSNGVGKNPRAIDLTGHLCTDSQDTLLNSGTSALIRLANKGVASISIPYISTQWEKARFGTIMYLTEDGAGVNSKTCFDVRGTDFTSAIKSSEGYNSIKVIDVNGDGLDDFVAFAEPGGNSENSAKSTIKELVFLQKNDSTFEFSNDKLNLPFLYRLPNVDVSKNFNDWLGNEFSVFDINGDGIRDLFNSTQFINQDAILKYGIRGGILNGKTKMENFSISPDRIMWNNESDRPYMYRYILPAEINNDGIVDFILIGAYIDQKIKSESNPYGIYLKASALLSKKYK